MDWLGMWKDGIRVVRRSPGFAAAIIITLGLGIGANSAIFSLINGVLIQPLPYSSGSELVRLRAGPVGAGGTPGNLSPLELVDLRERSRSLDAVLEYHTMFFNLLETDREPERVQVGVVSWNFFQTLGVDPVVGRAFSEDEDHLDAEPVLILGYDYWLSRFGGDPDVVGRSVEMNNRPHRIVGVLPPVPTYPNQNQVWMPWYACPFRSADSWHLNRQARSLHTVGRLADGVDVAAAEAEIDRIAQDLRAEFPDDYPGVDRVSADLLPLKEELTTGAQGPLLTLMAMSVLVLLIGCANVANLTLARVSRRQGDLVVQSALGASHGRIVRQLIGESLVLSLGGAVVAVAIAFGAVGLLADWAQALSPRFNEISVDGWVLAFTALISVAVGVGVAAGPALFSTRDVTTLRERSSSGSRASQRFRSGLVVVQVAIAFVLLSGSALMVRSMSNRLNVDPGFDVEDVLTLTIDLDWAAYPSRAEAVPFYRDLLTRIEERSQVEAAGVASDFPMSGSTFQSQRNLSIEGRPVDGQPPTINARFVSPGYFDAIQIPLVRGRAFERSDDAQSEAVVLLSQAASVRHFSNGDPIGQRISTDGGQSWATIVGVVGDVRQADFESGLNEEIYFPFEQTGFVRRLLVRAAGDPGELARALTEDVYSVDPNQPVSFVQTLEDAASARVASPRTITTLLSLFALVALVTAAFGILSVVAFTTSQRRHEIGVRLALGGERRDVVLMVLTRGLTMIGAGLVVGCAVTLTLSEALSGFLFGVSASDPATLGGVALGLLAIATVATWLPAWRGSTVSPVDAFKAD
ncbi:MAG: ABC transporter permease [Gemmatimonadota bacterium]